MGNKKQVGQKTYRRGSVFIQDFGPEDDAAPSSSAWILIQLKGGLMLSSATGLRYKDVLIPALKDDLKSCTEADLLDYIDLGASVPPGCSPRFKFVGYAGDVLSVDAHAANLAVNLGQ